MKNPCLNKKTVYLTAFTVLLIACLVNGASAQATVVKAEASSTQPKIGDTLTVNITISDVENLYGVDVSLNWNPTVLCLLNAKSMLGAETNPDGVLHEAGSDTLMIAEDSASQETGEYALVATSVGSAPEFSGSGIIATLTFNVTNAGETGLTLESQLSDHPAAGETSNFIDHTDTADTVTTVIPEYPSLIVVAMLITIATAALFVNKKRFSVPNF
jgi:hypothetical protein